MKRLITLMLLIVYAEFAFSQGTLSINAGVGQFKMSSMKSYQKYLQSLLPVETEVTSSFPSYFIYDIGAHWLVKNGLVLGGSSSFGSTGGRIYYSDYSGYTSSDQLIKFFSVGLVAGYRTQPFLNDHLIFQADLRPSLISSHLTTKYHFETESQHYSDESQFASQNLAVQPNLGLWGRFGRVGLNLQAGYNLNVVEGEFHRSNGQLPSSLSSEKVVADWSGLRASAGASFFLRKSEKESGEESEGMKSDIDDPLTLGVGVGFDYGGIGLNMLYYPHKNIGLFAGLGYALVNAGYNAGLKFRFSGPASKVGGYLSAMYGYNAVVAITNAPEYDRMFFGTTFGAGIDLKPRPGSSGYWTFGITLPIRKPAVDNYFNSLKAMGAQFERELSPLGISVGYRLLLVNR